MFFSVFGHMRCVAAVECSGYVQPMLKTCHTIQCVSHSRMTSFKYWKFLLYLFWGAPQLWRWRRKNRLYLSCQCRHKFRRTHANDTVKKTLQYKAQGKAIALEKFSAQYYGYPVERAYKSCRTMCGLVHVKMCSIQLCHYIQI